MAIRKDTLDQLLDGRDPKEVFNKDGLFDELKKALGERALNAEINDHLGGEAAEGILSHQPGDPMTTDGDPVIAKLARHARAAVGCVRQCKGRANMGQQHPVLILSTAGRSILPGKIAALANAKNLAETPDGEFLLRRIDETEPHRLPS